MQGEPGEQAAVEQALKVWGGGAPRSAGAQGPRLPVPARAPPAPSVTLAPSVCLFAPMSWMQNAFLETETEVVCTCAPGGKKGSGARFSPLYDMGPAWRRHRLSGASPRMLSDIVSCSTVQR